MRKVVLWLTITAMVTAVLATLALTSASAGRTPSASANKGQRVSPNAVTGPKKLIQTKFQYGFGSAVGAGNQPIDTPFTFTCPGTTTCAYEVEYDVQVIGSSANNKLYFITTIDGTDMDQGGDGPYLGYAPNGYYAAFHSSVGASGIAHGAHTLQSLIGTDNGLQIAYYRITYRLYKAA